MNMNIKQILYSLSYVALFASCSSEIDDNISLRGDELLIQTEIDNTRAVITGKSFSTGDSIGVCVLKADGSVYTANSGNIPAAYDGSKWNMEGNVTLGSDAATVYGYYPYTAGVTGSSVPVDVTPKSTTGQTDYLYGAAASTVNAASNTATIHFSHALARVTLQITKLSTDTGACKLTSVTLRNDSAATAIATAGTMDIKTGTITTNVNTNARITQAVNATLSTTTATNVDILVIPNTIDSKAVVSLVIDGKVYTTKLTADAWKSGQQYTYPISINRTSGGGGGTVSAGGTVGNMVDLGLSVKWADHNVGATNPEDYGGYCAWGETATKTDYSFSTSKWYNVSYASLKSQGVIDSNGNLSATYDAATVNWGKSWRTPTKAELDELKTKCTWTWTTTSNGIHGYKVIGTNGNSIFLPAAGYRYTSGLYSAGSDGGYWGSTAYDHLDGHAYFLYFGSVVFDWGYYGRNRGISVR